MNLRVDFDDYESGVYFNSNSCVIENGKFHSASETYDSMATHVSRILRVQSVLLMNGRSVATQSKDIKHFPLVVLGGGAGGCSVAARSCRMLGQGNVAVVEPAKVKKDNSFTRMHAHSFSTRPYQYIGSMLPVTSIVFVATRLSLLEQNVRGAFIKPNGRW